MIGPALKNACAAEERSLCCQMARAMTARNGNSLSSDSGERRRYEEAPLTGLNFARRKASREVPHDDES
jgi:hypothetical protein